MLNSNKVILLVGLLGSLGCSTTHTVNGIKLEKDEILSTLNDSSKPDWCATGATEPFRIVDGKVMSVGQAEIPGSDRPTAGLRIAYNNALATISKTVENKIQSLFQNAEEGTGYDSTSAHYIGSELSSITANDIRNSGQFYERIAQSNEDGSKKIIYRLCSLATIDEGQLKHKIAEAAAKAAGKKEISQAFQAQVTKHLDSLVDQAVSANQSASKSE